MTAWLLTHLTLLMALGCAISSSQNFLPHLSGKHRCVTLTPHLLDATKHVLETISPTNLHVLFEGKPDMCLLEVLWERGIGVVGMEEIEWWGAVSHIHYTTPSQHLLVGHLNWLVRIMVKVRELYKSGQLGALHTHWVWVLSGVPGVYGCANHSVDIDSVDQSGIHSTNHSSITNVALTSRSFSLALEAITDALQEGMMGVAVGEVLPRPTPTPTPPPTPTPTPTYDIGVRSSRSLSGVTEMNRLKVVVSGVQASGGGEWRLQEAGWWSDGQLQVNGPLWPAPPVDLQGRLVRVTYSNKPNVFTHSGKGGLELAEGYLSQLIRELQKYLNFTSTLVPTKGFGSVTADGSWNGMIGVIARGEADIAPLDFTPMLEREGVVDFSLSLSQDVVVILVKAPLTLITPFLLLQIFSLQMWASVVGVAVVVGVVLNKMVRLEERLTGLAPPAPVGVYLASILSIFVYQSRRQWPRSFGGRLVSSVMMGAALVVGSIYCSSITAFLAIPFRSKPVDSLEDLVDSNMIPVVRSRVTVYNFLICQEEGLLGEVKERMVALSEEDIGSWDFFSKVADGTFALVGESNAASGITCNNCGTLVKYTYSSAVGRAQLHERRGKKCLFHLAKKPIKVDQDAIVFAKNSFLKTQVDKVLRWFRCYGIIEQLKKPYYSVTCLTHLCSDQPQVMTLHQTQGAFYVLAFGMMLATITFMAELALSSYNTSAKRDRHMERRLPKLTLKCKP